MGDLVRDDGVEGHALISSCKAPKSQLLNSHVQEDSGTHQKKIPHVQRQRRSHNEMVEGMQS